MEPRIKLLAAALILTAAVTALGQVRVELPYADGSARLARGARAVTLTSRFNRGHPYVETYINGKGPYSFVLDTGASYSVMLPALAKSFGLKERKVKGTEFTYVDAALRVPGVEADRHRFYTFVEQLPGAGVAGLLGHDFLRQFVVEVDYSRPAVVLHDPKQFRRPAGDDTRWEAVPLKVENNSPIIPVRLNYFRDGSEEFPALIDTGANATPMMTEEPRRQVSARMVESAQVGEFYIRPFVCCDDIPIHPLSHPPFPYQMILPGSALRESGARLILDYQGGEGLRAVVLLSVWTAEVNSGGVTKPAAAGRTTPAGRRTCLRREADPLPAGGTHLRG